MWGFLFIPITQMLAVQTSCGYPVSIAHRFRTTDTGLALIWDFWGNVLMATEVTASLRLYCLLDTQPHPTHKLPRIAHLQSTTTALPLPPGLIIHTGNKFWSAQCRHWEESRLLLPVRAEISRGEIEGVCRTTPDGSWLQLWSVTTMGMCGQTEAI